MTIFQTSDCTCGVWHSILSPPPCRIHQPADWGRASWAQPYITTTGTSTVITAPVTYWPSTAEPVKRTPPKSRKHG